VGYLFTGFASGIFEIVYENKVDLNDGSLNTFIGQLKNSTALLGMLHAAYGLGCAISPIVSTRMVAAGLGWNSYYYVLLGWATTNTIIIWITYHPKFMKEEEEVETTELTVTDLSVTAGDAPALTTSSPPEKSPLRIAFTSRFCWLAALFLVLYLGMEISTGGWVVSFMIQVRPQS
jgi:fucose permease